MTELVRVRCARCRKVLHVVTQRPADWHGPDLEVLRCQCDFPTHDRMLDVMQAKGITAIGMTLRVPWSTLRRYVEMAERRGKPTDIPVKAASEAVDGKDC